MVKTGLIKYSGATKIGHRHFSC